LKILEELGINLFRNLRINIFIYYFVTVNIFLAILYYILTVLHIDNIFLLTTTVLCFVTLSGIFISKLAVDPLSEYISNLQNLSKETLHELNLPISTIVSNTSLLKKNNSNEKSLKRILRIEKSCEMLKERYNELDYAIKSQSMQELNEEIDLKVLVEDRVEFLQALYPHIDFQLKLSPCLIFNDKRGISKVIDNIIDNGVKYSKNSTLINIYLHNNSLEIQDFGCGMDEVELLKIFEGYYQSNKSAPGFGIGLNMVKRFCDKNAIQLNFTSQKESGTTVTLIFKNI